MKENINYKILYRILRQYSYNRNMEAMNILYKELVLEGVIPEFKFNMEVWKNDKSGKNVWKWYQASNPQLSSSASFLRLNVLSSLN